MREQEAITHGTYDVYMNIPLKRDIAIILNDGNVITGEFQDVVLTADGNDIIYIKDNTTVRYDDIKHIMLIEDYEKEGE